jgi:hypothetical protein
MWSPQRAASRQVATSTPVAVNPSISRSSPLIATPPAALLALRPQMLHQRNLSNIWRRQHPEMQTPPCQTAPACCADFTRSSRVLEPSACLPWRLLPESSDLRLICKHRVFAAHALSRTLLLATQTGSTAGCKTPNWRSSKTLVPNCASSSFKNGLLTTSFEITRTCLLKFGTTS